MAAIPQLGELLLARRLISSKQLEHALKLQRQSPQSLSSILISAGYVAEDRLLQALAAQWGVSAWHLEKDPPRGFALRKIPASVCRQYHLLPVQVRGDLLMVAMRNPNDLTALEMARNLSGMRVEPVLADEDRLHQWIDRVLKGEWDDAQIEDHVNEAMSEYSGSNRFAVEQHDLTQADDSPVVNLVNQILGDAVRAGASDVHFEPENKRVELRFRLDGQLTTVRDIPHELLLPLATRLKIMSELDIVEYRLPQDGRISAVIDARTIDFRMSVLPTVYGPRIVLRVLDRTASLKSLEEIGFAPENLPNFRRLIHRPYGLFLVTGPTGSGKTTTLYASLQEVRTGANNVMTCEDPVEYEVPGIAQSQVNEKVGLTFGMQLRAILRQDPDVVLVGEIRDQETADTAIRASLTGHMVFSTLHCNDAISAIPRLLDMGVEPFLLSSSLVGVMSQRLVRRVCSCSTPRPASAEERLLFAANDVAPPTNLLEPKGCDRCFETGFRGRIAVHELLTVDQNLASMIAHKASTGEMLEAAQLRTLQTDALHRVIAGITTLDEVRRVVAFDAPDERRMFQAA
jgi:type IV pilus assembly protein PilB